MDIIPIQASSVPCEWVFSSGKATMAPQRSCISAQLMAALQILKFSIWKDRPLSLLKEWVGMKNLRDLSWMHGWPLQMMQRLMDGAWRNLTLTQIHNLMDEVDGLTNEFDALEQELISELENSENKEGDGDDIYWNTSLWSWYVLKVKPKKCTCIKLGVSHIYILFWLN